jgi:hypothetical protein
MKPNRLPNRWYFIGIPPLLGVLVLGIVQWSFLPILIQNGPVGCASLEMSASHSSKFAAPFKFLFADGLQPCVVRAGNVLHRVTSRIYLVAEVPIHCSEALFLSSQQLRAPPTA